MEASGRTPVIINQLLDHVDNRRLTDATNLYHLCPGTPPQDSGVPGYYITGVLTPSAPRYGHRTMLSYQYKCLTSFSHPYLHFSRITAGCHVGHLHAIVIHRFHIEVAVITDLESVSPAVPHSDLGC